MMIKTISILVVLAAVGALAAYFLMPHRSLYQRVLNDLKIEHVFNIPSLAYGPGSVYIRARKAGYIGVCLPWNVIGCTEADYPARLKAFDIPEWQQAASREEKVKFTDEELKAVSADFAKIASLKLELSNGKVCLVYSHLSELAGNTKMGVNRKDIDAALEMYPKSKVFLAINCYQYDVKIAAKDDRGVDITATIPAEALKLILPEIGINIRRTDEVTMSGRAAYVGFNGGSIKFSDIGEEELPTGPEERILIEGGPPTFRSLVERPGRLSMMDITKETGNAKRSDRKPD